MGMLKNSLLGIAMMSSLIACHRAEAQAVIGWDGANSGVGGNDRIYGRKQNWPGNDTPDTTSEIAFFDTTITGNITINTSNQNSNTGPPWTINGVRINTANSPTVTFSNNGAIYFGGSAPALELQDTNAAVFNNELRWNSAGSIEHTSSGILNIAGTTVLNTDLAINHTGSGDISFTNQISGAGGVTVGATSTGTVDYSYLDRSFTGDFVINGGTVNADDPVDDNQHIIIGLGIDQNNGRHLLGQGDVTVNGGELNLTTVNDHIVVNTGNNLTLNGGTLNVTTSAPDTGNDFRLEWGTYTQTGGTATFDLGDDFNMYEGIGANDGEAGQAFISGGAFNATVRDQFRSYQSNGTGKLATFSVTNGADANIVLNGVRGIGGSQGGVVAANYNGSSWIFDGCGTTIDFSAASMAASTPHMVNISGNTSITDGAIATSSIPVVLNRMATLTGDNSANTTCPTGPGELRLIGTANLYVNQTPTLTNAPNFAFESASNQRIYSVTDGAAPTTTSGSYGLPDNNIGGSGTLSGAGTIRKAGSGALTIDASMGAGAIDAAEVVIEGGTLLLGADNQFTTGTGLDLDGGIFGSNGFDSSMGSLTLSSTSTVDLGGGGSIVEFTDGSRTAGTFTVTNWNGNFDGGGSDQIIFGTSVNQAFLDNVFWQDLGLYGARQLPSGEIVPIPEPGTYAIGAVLLGGIFWLERRRRSDPRESAALPLA